MSPEIKSQEYRLAELRSELARISALFVAFGILLAVLLIRGVVSLADGHRGETWPFAVLLAASAIYELGSFSVVRRALKSGRSISRVSWGFNIIVESALPTAALFLQTHTSFLSLRSTLTAPGVMIYFVFIILSTLHLDFGLSLLSGAVSSAGYLAVCVYTLSAFPVSGPGGDLYGTLISSVSILMLGGLVAAAVAAQIRGHVIAAVRDAESHAKLERVEHDLEIARSIQLGLLPNAPPALDGFDIAGWNQPADETGGDYFDWQPREDGRLAVTIADVTGHGIGAALCMSACRAYARAALGTESDLQGFLGSVNRLLCEDLPPEKFVTLAAGLLNPSDSTMQLISAGHGPLIHYSPSQNRFRNYDAQGVPLGLLSDFNWASPQLLRFVPGDIFMLTTDGFVEWANVNDEEFGLDRMKELLRTSHTLSAKAIVSKLYSAVVKFGGPTHQLDDLTVIVIKKL